VSASTPQGHAEGRSGVTRQQALAGLVLAMLALWLLAPFAGVDPPDRLTSSNAPWTDEGFNLANARERVLTGRFATGEVDRSLTNGAYSALAAGVFTVTGPSLAAGRALSMVAVAGAVLLLALGLAGPLGRPAALLSAAALGGSNLLLEHGRLALVEATVVVLLAGAFVLAARAAWRPSPAAGVGLGLLVAAAVSVKAIALLPGVVMLGVVLVAAARRRDRTAMTMGLAGLATLVLAGAAWLLAVAVPNWERFRTALRIWPRVEYLDGPVAVAGRLGRYLVQSDQAIGRSLPLLLAAGIGLLALVHRWRRLDPGAEAAQAAEATEAAAGPQERPRGGRDALVMAALWGVGLWLAVAVADYLPGHYTAPNRYVVPALPGLAVLAGFGLAELAAAAGRRRAALVGVALGLAVAVPGVVAYLDGALGSGRTRELGQRVLATNLPAGAVVYGAYAPTLLFDTRLDAFTPWPSADANVRDPVGRLGVTHVLVGGDPADPTGKVPTLTEHGAIDLVARVRWGPQELVLYGLPPRAEPGVSPVATVIDYHPGTGSSQRRR
jgi:4-amino-4-deoxy-L-arabinose transferase-like glycosyltransferase